jgi:hypothetical protein
MDKTVVGSYIGDSLQTGQSVRSPKTSTLAVGMKLGTARPAEK